MNGPHIQFFGTLTRDPEQCYSKDDGIPFARLRVAVRTRYDDDHPPDTNDFEVYLWSYQMDTAVAHCRKGQQMYVFGRLSGRERHRGPRPLREHRGVPLLPGGGGRPAGAGHQRGASGGQDWPALKDPVTGWMAAGSQLQGHGVRAAVLRQTFGSGAR